MRKPKNKHPVTTVSPSPTLFKINGKYSSNGHEPEANLKRQISVGSQKNWSEDTIIYGEDDALPLRIALAVEESPAASSCIGTIAKFIKGSGFSDPELMKIKIDKNGTTLWDLHCSLSDSLALFWGFSINFKFNRNGKITNSYPLSFESCRFKVPADKSPYITHIVHNPYFGGAEKRVDDSVTYSVFDAKTVVNEIGGLKNKAEIDAYPGQVYYYGRTSPLSRFYPKPKYWSAKEAIQADHKLQEFTNEELDNGFFQSVLINAIGDPNKMSSNPATQCEETDTAGVKRMKPTETVGQEFNRQMGATFSGSKKAGTALVLWSQNADSSIKVQAFPTTINSDRLVATQDSITKTITIATEVPSILANISEGVNLGSGGSEIQKAVELMQSRTVEWREILQNFYNLVLIPNMEDSPKGKLVEIQNYSPVSEPLIIDEKFWEQLSSKEKRDFVRSNFPKIKLDELTQESAPTQRTLIEVIGVGGSQALMEILAQYGEQKLTELQASNILQILFGVSPEDAARMLQKTATPGTDQETTEQPIPEQEPAKINENFRNLTGKQFQNVQRIVKKFNKGEITTEQASDMLRVGFGMTDEQIAIWLVTPEEE